ncbi:MAG: phage tail terminator protein [Alphaproteobacteria bacterium]
MTRYLEDALTDMSPIVAQLSALRPPLAEVAWVATLDPLPALPMTLPAAFVAVAEKQTVATPYAAGFDRLVHTLTFEVMVALQESGPLGLQAQRQSDHLRAQIMRCLAGFRHPAAASDTRPAGSTPPKLDDDQTLWWSEKFSFTAIDRAQRAGKRFVTAT